MEDVLEALEELKKIPKEQIVIVDTCAFSPKNEELLWKIGSGWHGVKDLTENYLKGKIDQVNAFVDHFPNRDIVILREVYEELKVGLDSVHNSLSFLRNDLNRGAVMKYGDKLELLEDYSNDFHSILKRLKKHDLRVSFFKKTNDQTKKLSDLYKDEMERFRRCLIPKEKKVLESVLAKMNGLADIDSEELNGKFKMGYRNYIPLISLALNYGKDMRFKAVGNLTRRKKAGNGLVMNTDNKIVATAYSLAYFQPVHILTRDRGLERLVERVGEGIFNGKTQEEYKLRGVPRHDVEVTNLFDYCDDRTEEVEETEDSTSLV
ncbi:hypothetical protein ACFLZZ_00940 [Nanoarchaeota archaeon]